MTTKKKSKPHSSARKTAARSTRAKKVSAKKASSKRSKSAAKSRKPKKGAERPAWLKRRDELTLKLFQMAYEANQRGEFHRL